MKYKNGFTLVEVMIAITILGVIGVMTATILSRTYKVNNQSDSISKLKNNGDLAINSISEILRNGEGVICYSDPLPTPSKSMVVRTLAGKYVKFRFVEPIPPTGTPTQNGYIIKQENLDPANLSTFCSINLTPPAEVAISNNHPVSGVSISGGSFLKLTGAGGKDLVTIKFDVRPTLSNSGVLASDKFSVQTTLQIR